MERFLCLPIEKQNQIVDAALSLFGSVGYKKASVADIAEAAGISKAMVFYYFGSKKALYLYLCDFSGKLLKDEIDKGLDKNITDFFDKIKQATEIKMSVLKKFPGILSFLTSMYFETHKEVAEDIKRVVKEGETFSAAFVFGNAATHKFKDDVDPQLVLQILTYYSEGYISKAGKETNFEKLMKDFYKCMELMRKNFYKEEYL